jgi:hypothetical protein
MDAYRELEIWMHTFLTWALNGGEWSVSCSGCFTSGERDPNIHYIEKTFNGRINVTE